MVQEATMILMDNTSYMRNGDFIPDRFQAQKEALLFLFNTKKRQNVENVCGLMTLSNNQVLCTLTTDTCKIQSKMMQVKPEGESSFYTGISIANLVLRNRLSRNQKPRIMAFIGSPIADKEEDLIKLAKKLKKEKVSVTVVNFGEVAENEHLLTKFINTINGGEGKAQDDGSLLVVVPPGNGIQEYLRTNPSIMSNSMAIDRSGGALSGGAPAGQGGGGGVDDGNAFDDPDLAYALRISLEEQRAREQREANSAAATNETIILKSKPVPQFPEEQMLQQTLESQNNVSVPTDEAFQAMTEEEQVQYALNLSMKPNNQIPPSPDNDEENKEGSPPKVQKRDSEVQD